MQEVVASDGMQLTRVVGSKSSADLDRPRDVAIHVGRGVVKAGDQLAHEPRSSVEGKAKSFLEELVDIHPHTLPERATRATSASGVGLTIRRSPANAGVHP
ncbi:MAG: hypothetical protein WAT74_01585, partial [Flavobacteriales bacterium]